MSSGSRSKSVPNQNRITMSHGYRSEPVPNQKWTSTKSEANQYQIRSKPVPNQNWISTKSEVNQYQIRSESVPNQKRIRSKSVPNQKRISTKSELNHYTFGLLLLQESNFPFFINLFLLCVSTQKWTMAYIAGINKGPVLDWTDDTSIMEHYRIWKKWVEILFHGPLNTAGDGIKCNYLIYWAGKMGMDLVDKWQ